MRLTINRDGRIDRIRTVEANSKLLEDHTIALLKSLAPFEPIPPDAKENYFELGASCNYVKH